jgi:hypothetical protein
MKQFIASAKIFAAIVTALTVFGACGSEDQEPGSASEKSLSSDSPAAEEPNADEANQSLPEEGDETGSALTCVSWGQICDSVSCCPGQGLTCMFLSVYGHRLCCHSKGIDGGCN